MYRRFGPGPRSGGAADQDRHDETPEERRLPGGDCDGRAGTGARSELEGWVPPPVEQGLHSRHRVPRVQGRGA